MKVDRYELMLAYAFNLLGKRMYGECELRNKLVKRFRCNDSGDGDGASGSDSAAMQHVIARLTELRYLDDAAYVRAFIRQAFGIKAKGMRWIYQELTKRGVAKNLIEACLRDDVAELDAAVAFARKRAPQITRRIVRKGDRRGAVQVSSARASSVAFEINGHLMQLLTSRGFTFDVAKQAIELIEADLRELLT